MTTHVAGEYNATPPSLTSGDTETLQLDSSGNLKVTGTVTATPTGTQTVSGTVQTVAPVGGAYTDRSIANLAGTSETLMAANANRRILVIHNIGATDIAVNLTGGAASLTAGGSIKIATGGSLILDNYPPTGAITIIGTAAADVTAYEG